MTRPEGWVKRFCDLMGRHNAVTRLVDRAIAWLGIPTSPPPLLLGFGSLRAGVATAGLPDGFMAMAGPPVEIGPNRGPAPVSPKAAHGSRPGNRAASASNCNHLRYRGMHGTPCLYEDGALTKCPPGTAAGGYWVYRVPNFGDVYYVDCCGKNPRLDVFCNWTAEPNWCFGVGGNLYTCTLALKKDDYGKTWSFTYSAGRVTWTGV